MTPAIQRITVAVPTLGLGIVALAWLLAGTTTAAAAMVGAAVATVNWIALRWFVSRALNTSDRSRAGLMVLLGAKMLVLGLVCWGLLTRFALEPFGFALGLSALVLGIFLGSVFATPARPALGEES